MLPYAIAVVMILLWLLGLALSWTFHGLIHLLLVIAVVVLLLKIVSSKGNH